MEPPPNKVGTPTQIVIVQTPTIWVGKVQIVGQWGTHGNVPLVYSFLLFVSFLQEDLLAKETS